MSVASFEDLGLGPELVEALAAEGVEVPSEFQAAALPVVRRGNNLVGRAGPGAGVLVTYGAALLDRLEPGEARPSAVVVTPTPAAARRLAESLARLALATGHDVAALGSAWALPERADILFGSAADLMARVREARLKLSEVRALVIDGAAALEGLGGLADLTTMLEGLGDDAQRVVISLPLTEGVSKVVARTVRRAVTVPPGPGEDEEEGSPVRRGALRYLVTPEDPEEALLAEVSRILESEGSDHVLLFTRSGDRAADAGDLLSLHGYLAGAPGDASAPVWLGVDAGEARDAVPDGADVSVVSLDVPPDTDTLDRRHGGGAGGTVLLRSREIPHLRFTARAAGYELAPAPLPTPPRIRSEREAIVRRLEGALRDGELAPHFLLLEPLLDRWSPAEIAAAALSLVAEGAGGDAGTATGTAAGTGTGTTGTPAAGPPPAPSRHPTAWVHLYVSVGEKDGAGPGDILGAIAGEAGIEGSRVGKIEVRDTYTKVEVDEAVAAEVVRAVNGTTISGRAARVDYDRGAPGDGPKRRRSD